MTTTNNLPDLQVQLHGGVWDFDSLVNMMDDEIRELVHYEATKQEMSNQQFLDAYCKLHFAKHHEEFMI